MSTHRRHTDPGTYFVTFTCFLWLPLIHVTNSYESVYRWFSAIEEKGGHIAGYVIMPNHVHCLIHVPATTANLNSLVANGKRFLAYAIVKKLVAVNHPWLRLLKGGVPKNERNKGKKHQVWIPSFDAKLCFDRKMLEQKLDYIHANPAAGKWNLADDFVDYRHSSASFYETGVHGAFEVTHYLNL